MAVPITGIEEKKERVYPWSAVGFSCGSWMPTTASSPLVMSKPVDWEFLRAPKYTFYNNQISLWAYAKDPPFTLQ